LLCALGYDLFWRRFHGLLRRRHGYFIKVQKGSKNFFDKLYYFYKFYFYRGTKEIKVTSINIEAFKNRVQVRKK
jgi:hypothetical protein